MLRDCLKYGEYMQEGEKRQLTVCNSFFDSIYQYKLMNAINFDNLKKHHLIF